MCASAMAVNLKAFLGMNSSKYLFSNEIINVEHKNRNGFNGGLGISIQINERINLETGAIYGTGGAQTQIVYSPDQKLDGFYRNHFIAIPLNIKYRFLADSSPYVALGPEFTYILFHELEIIESKETYSVLEQTRRLNWGLALIAGYELAMKKVRLFVELSFHHGFSNLLKDFSATVRSDAFVLCIGVEKKKNAD